MQFRLLSVCTDCLIVIANGDYSGMDDKREQEVKAGIARCDALSAGTDEYGFSWRPCEVCHSQLGGDRHQAWEEIVA